MKSLIFRLFFGLFVLVKISHEETTLNECASNPCPDACDICINVDIRCIRAPCPQYMCQRNETCYNNKGVGNDSRENVENPKCLLEADSGNCLAYFPKWFFNATSKRCEKFIYGGCGGNENKFSTRLECERICIDGEECPMVKLVAPPPGCRYDKSPGPDGCPTNELICDVKPGNCPSDSSRVSSDTCLNECSTDTDCANYSKCCSIDCSRLCLSPEIDNATSNLNDIPKSKICLLDKEPGLCEAAISRWYFDAKSLECRQFIYGGCGGNLNRFSTKKECERVCFAGKECLKLKEVAPPEGCRFQAELGEDGCPMNKIICNDVKPGSCPASTNTIRDVCLAECKFDNDCRDDQKCCKYDCSSVCLSPASKNDTIEQDSKKSDLCPSMLPATEQVGICAMLCSNDTMCKPNQKCCRNGCGGTECMSVERRKPQNCNLFCPFAQACKIIDDKPQCVPTVVCPMPLLQFPPVGCTYNTKVGVDGCPQYELVCNNADPCSSNPCKSNERCAVLPCFVAPCTEYQCLPVKEEPSKDNSSVVLTNDACKNNDCLPCQKCIKTPLMCLRAPCRQYMCQDACGECSTCTSFGMCQQLQPSGNVVCSNDLCRDRQCRLYPQARCFVDQCNCDRYLYRLPNNTVITPGQCTDL